MGRLERRVLDARRAQGVPASFAWTAPTALASLATLAALAALSALTACETPPAKEAPAPVAKETGVSAAPVAAAVAPPPAAEPPPPPPPGTAQRLVIAAIELLEAGNEEQASVELQRALQAEPGHRLAQNLLRQITGDPLAMLGRESFIYRVQPGETLSRIAQRFLGDVHQFYILARYNDIKVPRQLAGGQAIRVPGKAPPAASVVSPPPAAAASAAPAATRVSSPADAARAERDRAERERAGNITRLTRAARASFARQDLDNAIRQWDQVLELDADNANAKLERQRAIELKERLKKVR